MNRRPSSRTAAYIVSIIWLTIVWILLWGELSITTIAVGIIVAIGVIIVFPLPGLDFTGRVRPLRIAVFFVRLLGDLVISSFIVSWLAIAYGPKTRSAVIAVKLHTDNDLYLTWIAESLSLVPGSLIVEARRSTRELFIHLLGVRDEADIERQRTRVLNVERRLLRAIASPAELAAYERALSAERAEQEGVPA